MDEAREPGRGITATRRRFLRGAGLSGLAVSAALAPTGWRRPAFAQEAGDATIAAFLESIELAVVDAYERIDPELLTPGLAATLTGFAGHHREHAAALGEVAGDVATGEANRRLLDDLDDQLAGARDQAEVVAFALSLESSAAATYLVALGALEARRSLELAASVLPVESEHAVVFGTVLERPSRELVPSFQDQDAAFKRDAFPVD